MRLGPVADAAPFTPASRLAVGFNDFLFAQIRDDSGGEPLSVVSALARVDVDPWAEAAALALMPVDAAAQRLAMLLAKLPAPSLVPGISASAAPGLIALLPKPALGPRNRFQGGANDDVRHVRIVGLFLLVFLTAATVGVLVGRPPARTAVPLTRASAIQTSPPPTVPAPAPTRTVGP